MLRAMIICGGTSHTRRGGAWRALAAVTGAALMGLAGCAVYPAELGAPAAPGPAAGPGTPDARRHAGARPQARPRAGAPAERTAAAPAVRPAPAGGTAAKITVVTARIPYPSELPGLVGRIQHHTVAAGEDLLKIARNAGIGFRALRDANPRIDEWEPKPGTDLVVPTQWILPRASERGLVINVAELRLYMFPEDARGGEVVHMLTWPVGAGDSEWPTPLGTFTVKSKDEHPTWVVPSSIYPKMENPRWVVPPGPDNPLGDYRIRLSIDTYLIHGTNDPWTVGRLTTHGCVRLYPEDIARLYTLVDRGTPGEFIYEPVKLGEQDGRIYAEVHRDIYQRHRDLQAHARDEVARAGVMPQVDPERLRSAVEAQSGLPVDVTRDPAPAS
jgi:L,D-transpeptidase ErfK/SrfK